MPNIFDHDNEVNEDLKDRVKQAFETLKMSGRPDIEIDKKSITSELYVDLKENDLILKEAKNHLMHTFFIGRKGTGKSTIFMKAMEELNEEFLGLYINLQTCYEYASDEGEIDNTFDEKVKRIIVKTNFLIKFLDQLKERLQENANLFARKRIDKELEKISKIIEDGREINIKETTKVWNQKMQEIGKEKGLKGSLGLSKSPSVKALYKKYGKDIETRVFETVIQKYFSITDIVNSIFKSVISKVSKIIIFLDDYSELNQDIQLIVANFILAPIIASYSDYVVFKVAGYPDRVEFGPNIDQTKINKEFLDYYEIYKGLKNFREMEKGSKEYLKRILEKRLEIITNKIKLQDLFDNSKDLDSYLDILSNATINNPRSLGFILSYAFENTINLDKKITQKALNSAIESYCLNQILADFNNDKRYKSSFSDKENILDLFTQHKLSETIINQSKNLKKLIIEKFNDRSKEISVPKSILNQIEKKRIGQRYFIPTSHFHINIGFEKYLKTLELYFILSKLNEISSKDGRQQISIYALNYGICLINNIDYGRYENQPKYWQERIWNNQKVIESVINSLVEIKCKSCKETFKPEELETIKKFNYYCYKCNTKNTVKVKKKYPPTLMSEAAKIKKFILPDHYIEVLRCLYNHLGENLLSRDISFEIDKHVNSVTGALRSLRSKKLVKMIENKTNYWKITNIAIKIYFE